MEFCFFVISPQGQTYTDVQYSNHISVQSIVSINKKQRRIYGTLQYCKWSDEETETGVVDTINVRQEVDEQFHEV
jgi:hypothetical protein